MSAATVVRRVLLALVIVLVLALITGFFWLRYLGSYLVRAEQPAKSDVILVLGGDWTGQRILQAAELAQRGYAPRVWVSGPMALYGINEATLAVNFAVEHGYPRSLFEIKVIPAHSTRQEAEAFRREFEKNNIHRVLLVTSNFHTRRASGIFRSVLGNGYEVHVVSAPYAYFHPDDWWKRREDQKTWFMEWSKLIAGTLGL